MLSSLGVFGSDADEVKSVSVKEGNSVTLYTDVPEKHRNQMPCVQLALGPEDPFLAILCPFNVSFLHFSDRYVQV